MTGWTWAEYCATPEYVLVAFVERVKRQAEQSKSNVGMRQLRQVR